MKISALVTHLNNLRDVYGDVEVFADNNGTFYGITDVCWDDEVESGIIELVVME